VTIEILARMMRIASFAKMEAENQKSLEANLDAGAIT
jgi:hypothetical protein